MTTDTTAVTRRIPELDGWRGISIFLVVFSHIAFNRYPDSPFLGLATVPFGAWGVRLFFVISGFIICKLTLTEIERTGRFHIGAFWLRRVFRIIPPMLVYIVFIAAIAATGQIQQASSDLVRASLFACNLPQAQCGWYVGHTWSLAFEEQFYIIFPVLMLFGPRRVKVIALALAIGLIVGSRPAIGEAVLGGKFGRDVSGYLGSFVALLVGVLCALHERGLRRLVDRAGPALTALASLALLAVVVDALFGGDSSPWHNRLRSFADVTLVPVAMAWLIFYSIFRRGVMTPLLTSAPALWLGKVSYSLYLWQQLFAAAPAAYGPHSIFLFWPAMFAIAWLSYQYVERPAARLGKTVVSRWLHRRRGVAPT